MFITYNMINYSKDMKCSLELNRKPINPKNMQNCNHVTDVYKGHPSLAPPQRRPRPSALHGGGHAALPGGDGYAESGIARGWVLVVVVKGTRRVVGWIVLVC